MFKFFMFRSPEGRPFFWPGEIDRLLQLYARREKDIKAHLAKVFVLEDIHLRPWHQALCLRLDFEVAERGLPFLVNPADRWVFHRSNPRVLVAKPNHLCW